MWALNFLIFEDSCHMETGLQSLIWIRKRSLRDAVGILQISLFVFAESLTTGIVLTALHCSDESGQNKSYKDFEDESSLLQQLHHLRLN
jgi:hypothetical protein